MPGSRSSHARTRLVLPPPDGAARTKRQPDAGGALVAIGSAPTYSRPPWPSSCNDAWSVGRRRSFGDANLSAAGPSQGANSSPSGGSAAANAASVGVHKLLHILHLRAHSAPMPSQLVLRTASNLAPSRRRDAAKVVSARSTRAATLAASSSAGIDGSAKTPGQRRISLIERGRAVGTICET